MSSLSQYATREEKSGWGEPSNESNTYSHLDAQLRLRLCLGVYHRTHTHVHVHCDSFGRRQKSYVRLQAPLEEPRSDGIVLPRTPHLPVTGRK